MKEISNLSSLLSNVIGERNHKMAETSKKPDAELIGTINEVALVRDSEEIFLWCSTCSVMVAKGFGLERSEGKATDHKHGRTVINRWD